MSSTRGTGKQAAAKLLNRPAPGSNGNTTNGSLLLSAYASMLPPEQLSRYVDKISSIRNQDPYLLKMSTETLPSTVTFESIINYALFKQSPYTGSRFHCFKAVDSKNRFEAGMVKLVEGTKIENKDVVRAKVMHSMSVTSSCLTPWIIIEGSSILCAHCDCIAGVGEVCSHVGAVLYYLTNIYQQQLINQSSQIEEVAVTDRPQQWGQPNKSISENLQQQIADIDYGYEVASYDDAFGNIPRLSVEELRNVFANLSRDGSQCSAMQVFCNDSVKCFRCTSSSTDPNYLMEGVLLDSLYDSALEQHSIEQLHFIGLQMYNRMRLNLDEALQRKIERDTVAQHKNQLWKKMRVGRVTASIVKRVCSTSLEKPAISIVNTICYPDLSYFSTQATQHGKVMEKAALNQLRGVFEKSHLNSSLCDSGLIIDLNHPELAASPDGLLKCDCCSIVPVEVKCPFRFKNENNIIFKLTKVAQPFIKFENNCYTIVKSHAYYAQVQMQIALTNAQYGYFYVWAKTEDLLLKVDKDPDYWSDMKTKSSFFFKVVILPELYAKYYTKRNERENNVKSLKQFRFKKPCAKQ